MEITTCGSVVSSSLASLTTRDRGSKTAANTTSTKANPRLVSHMNAVETIREDEYYVRNPNLSTGFYMTGGDGFILAGCWLQSLWNRFQRLDLWTVSSSALRTRLLEPQVSSTTIFRFSHVQPIRRGRIHCWLNEVGEWPR